MWNISGLHKPCEVWVCGRALGPDWRWWWWRWETGSGLQLSRWKASSAPHYRYTATSTIKPPSHLAHEVFWGIWYREESYANAAIGDISSELYGDWLWDENFKFCLIFTHFSRFSPFSGYIWWNNTLSSLENFSLNSILFFLFLMSHPDNGGFLKIAQKRDSISKKTSFCIMVINTDHQESWFLSVGHPLCALR